MSDRAALYEQGLTETEQRLIDALTAAHGEWVTSEALSVAAWGYYTLTTRVGLAPIVWRLRHHKGYDILRRRSVGYRLRTKGEGNE